MNRNNLIILYSLFIFTYPMGDSYYGEVIDATATIISLTCLVLLFKYYNQIPVAKTTILIYVTKLLICTLWLLQIRSAVLMFFINIFKNLMTRWIKDDFVTACSILNPTIFLTPIGVAYAEVMIMKIILLISPPTFLNLNNTWFKRTCVMCLFLPLVHSAYHFTRYKALCIQNMTIFVLKIHTIYLRPEELKINMKIVRPFPWLNVILLTVLTFEMVTNGSKKVNGYCKKKMRVEPEATISELHRVSKRGQLIQLSAVSLQNDHQEDRHITGKSLTKAYS